MMYGWLKLMQKVESSSSFYDNVSSSYIAWLIYTRTRKICATVEIHPYTRDGSRHKFRLQLPVFE